MTLLKDRPAPETLRLARSLGPFDADQLRALMAGRPAFFYLRGALDDRVAALRAALPATTRLAYSLKANPFAPLVGHLARQLDGADVTSFAEMATALNAGVAPADIMFAGPAKTAEEHRAAIALGVGICVESRTELERIRTAARDMGRPARVLLRLNPDFALSGASMRMGGAPTQFGLDVGELGGIWPLLSDPAIRFAGIHIYWGSQCLSEAAIEEAQRVAADLVLRLAPEFPCAPELLNLGGGFGIPYSERDRPLDLAVVGANFAPQHTRLAEVFPQARIFLELGRYLVGEAGVYVAEVVDRKTSYGVEFVVTDGGMHHFLAASGNLGQKIRRNYPISLIPGGQEDREAGSLTEYEIVGALCTPIDLLGHKVAGPEIRIGDLICLHFAGAYGRSASPVDFLSHPHPREFLI